MRLTKRDHYIKIAKTIAERSTCSRRKFGAIIVKDDVILSTGYNGSVRGALNCGTNDMPCLKDIHNEERNKSYNYCPAVHAEVNAIINAARTGISILGGTLYLSPVRQERDGDTPCIFCKRIIINSGLKDCFYVAKPLTNNYARSLEPIIILWAPIKDWIFQDNEWMKENMCGDI